MLRRALVDVEQYAFRVGQVLAPRKDVAKRRESHDAALELLFDVVVRARQRKFERVDIQPDGDCLAAGKGEAAVVDARRDAARSLDRNPELASGVAGKVDGDECRRVAELLEVVLERLRPARRQDVHVIRAGRILDAQIVHALLHVDADKRVIVENGVGKKPDRFLASMAVGVPVAYSGPPDFDDLDIDRR